MNDDSHSPEPTKTLIASGIGALLALALSRCHRKEQPPPPAVSSAKVPEPEPGWNRRDQWRLRVESALALLVDLERQVERAFGVALLADPGRRHRAATAFHRIERVWRRSRGLKALRELADGQSP